MHIVEAVVVGPNDGRMSSIAAPVVPVKLAITVPIPKIVVLRPGETVQIAFNKHPSCDRKQREKQD